MDPETEKRFEGFDERLRLAERRILTAGNLVSKVGIPSLIEAQMKIDSLMESDIRLYDSLQQLAESHKQLDRKLAESYQRTDEALNRLSAAVQAFIESMNRAGNGSES